MLPMPVTMHITLFLPQHHNAECQDLGFETFRQTLLRLLRACGVRQDPADNAELSSDGRGEDRWPPRGGLTLFMPFWTSSLCLPRGLGDRHVVKVTKLKKHFALAAHTDIQEHESL